MKILTALAQYLLAFQLAMSPAAEHPSETPAVVEARYTDIAVDVADVAMDPTEPPLFTGPLAREKTAVLLDAIAFHEGRLFDFVDDGSCNRKGYKADRRGTCDSGKAFSLWQVQPGHGIVLRGTEWAWWNIRSTERRIVGDDMIADRKLAVRVALHMARQSMHSGSLCVYTHEPCSGVHPNATARMQTAVNYFRAHPLPDGEPIVLVEPDWTHSARAQNE